MNKLQNRIMNIDFKKTAKRFIISALIILLLGGAIVGASYRTQIQEALTYHQTDFEGNDSKVQEVQNQTYTMETETGDREMDHEDFFDSAEFTQPTVGAMIILGSYLLLCMLIGMSFWLLIAAWLYQSAEKSAMNGLFWAVLGIFFNLAAVLAFLLLRSKKAVCLNCGRRQNAAEYCRSCGVALQRKCGACGALTDIRDIYCSNCGEKLNQESDSEKK